MANPAFRGRALVATLMLCGFMCLLASGLVLFISPNGRVARDMSWDLLWLDKWQWRDFHIAFGMLFFLTAFLHLWLNIKPLINYVRQKLASQGGQAPTLRWRLEPLLAILLCAFIGVSAAKGLPPVSYLADAKTDVMDYWQDLRRENGRATLQAPEFNERKGGHRHDNP